MATRDEYAKVVRESIIEMRKAGRWLVSAAANMRDGDHKRAVDFLGGAATIAISRACLPDISNKEIDAHVIREARRIKRTKDEVD